MHLDTETDKAGVTAHLRPRCRLTLSLGILKDDLSADGTRQSQVSDLLERHIPAAAAANLDDLGFGGDDRLVLPASDLEGLQQKRSGMHSFI